jgi:hypothetical protein
MPNGPKSPAEVNRAFTRREIHIALGAAGSGILGYLLLRPATHTGQAPAPGSAHPKLRGELGIEGPDGDGMFQVQLPSGELCALNAAGAEVVRRLDGAHSVEQIAAAMGRRAGIRPDAPLTAKVACFVAELGSAGFLERPFYAQIVERIEA